MNRLGVALSLEPRQYLACDAFSRTYAYDSAITTYLSIRALKERDLNVGEAIERFFVKQDHGLAQHEEAGLFVRLWLSKITDLRYGENPHQRGALYAANADLREDDRYLETGNLTFATLVSGKEMSFNNYVDADAAWQLVCDFDELASAIIKHTNPAGVALGSTTEEAYRRALACDPVSAFGGIVAFNRAVDEAAARAVTEIFAEVIVAPDYESAALEVLKAKKNLRVLRAGEPKPTEGLEYKQISGGMLVQTRDTHRLKREDLKVVTKRAPPDKEIDDLLFAWTVCKHTKSNAIVYARAKQTVGVGAGQM